MIQLSAYHYGGAHGVANTAPFSSSLLRYDFEEQVFEEVWSLDPRISRMIADNRRAFEEKHDLLNDEGLAAEAMQLLSSTGPPRAEAAPEPPREFDLVTDENLGEMDFREARKRLRVEREGGEGLAISVPVPPGTAPAPNAPPTPATPRNPLQVIADIKGRERGGPPGGRRQWTFPPNILVTESDSPRRDPLPRTGHSIVFRTRRGILRGQGIFSDDEMGTTVDDLGKLVLFGGCLIQNRQFDNALYEFDLETRRWEFIDPPGGVPPPMAYFKSLYFELADLLLVFGGIQLEMMPSRQRTKKKKRRVKLPPPQPTGVGKSGIVFHRGVGVGAGAGADEEEDDDPDASDGEADETDVNDEDDPDPDAPRFDSEIRSSNQLYVYSFPKQKWFEVEMRSDARSEVQQCNGEFANAFGNGNMRGMPSPREDPSMDWIGDRVWARNQRDVIENPEEFVVFGGMNDKPGAVLRGQRFGGGAAGSGGEMADRLGRGSVSSSSSFSLQPFRAFNDTWTYNLRLKRWKLVVPGTLTYRPSRLCPPARFGHASAVARGGLFIFGGVIADGRFLHDVWRLDLASYVWRMVRTEFVPSPMPQIEAEEEEEEGESTSVEAPAPTPPRLRPVRLGFHVAAVWRKPQPALIPNRPQAGVDDPEEGEATIVLFSGYDGNSLRENFLVRLFSVPEPTAVPRPFIPTFSVSGVPFKVRKSVTSEDERRVLEERLEADVQRQSMVSYARDFPTSDDVSSVLGARVRWILKNPQVNCFDVVLKLNGGELQVHTSRVLLLDSLKARAVGLFDSVGPAVVNVSSSFQIDLPSDTLSRVLAGATVPLSGTALLELYKFFRALDLRSQVLRTSKALVSVPQVSCLLSMLHHSLALFERRMMPYLKQQTGSSSSSGTGAGGLSFSGVYESVFTVGVMNALHQHRATLDTAKSFRSFIERIGMSTVWDNFTPQDLDAHPEVVNFPGTPLLRCFVKKFLTDFTVEMVGFEEEGGGEGDTTWVARVPCHRAVLFLRSDMVFQFLRREPTAESMTVYLPRGFAPKDLSPIFRFFYGSQKCPTDPARAFPFLLKMLRFGDWAAEGPLRRFVVDRLRMIHPAHTKALADLGFVAVSAVYPYLGADQKAALKVCWEDTHGEAFTEGLKVSKKLQRDVRRVVREKRELEMDIFSLQQRTEESEVKRDRLILQKTGLLSYIERLKKEGQSSGSRKRKRRDHTGEPDKKRLKRKKKQKKKRKETST